MPLREIERRVIPTMKGAQYLGFDFDRQLRFTRLSSCAMDR